MKFQMEHDFSKHIKSPELLRVYLLYGTQPYLIGQYEKLLVKKTLGGTQSAFNFHRFHSGNLEMQALFDAIEQLPILSDSQCVTLDLDLDKLDSASLSELCGVLADPPVTTTVIITIKRSPAKKERLRTLIKACDKAGGVAELNARRSGDLLRFLRDRAQKNGCELSGDTASYLIERCADDMQLLCAELDKLCAYVGSGTVSRADVDAVVTVVLQARVFDLSKAILRGNFSRAMELVDQLCGQREPIPGILAVLSGAFLDLYRGYAARQAGISPSQAAAELGYPKNREFAIKNAMSDSGSYTARQLRQWLSLLAEADQNLKSTGGNDRVLLEQTIAKLFLVTEKSERYAN